jgi:hypothetical protein
MDGMAAGLLRWLDEQGQKSVMDTVLDQLHGAGMESGALHTAAAAPVCLQVIVSWRSCCLENKVAPASLPAAKQGAC